MTLKANIEQRDGKDYLIINNTFNDTNSIIKCSNLKADLLYQNLTPGINYVINKLVNANWKHFYHMVHPRGNDQNFGNSMKLVLISIFDKVSIQDISHLK